VPSERGTKVGVGAFGERGNKVGYARSHGT